MSKFTAKKFYVIDCGLNWKQEDSIAKCIGRNNAEWHHLTRQLFHLSSWQKRPFLIKQHSSNPGKGIALWWAIFSGNQNSKFSKTVHGCNWLIGATELEN